MRIIIGLIFFVSSPSFAEPSSPKTVTIRYGDTFSCDLNMFGKQITRCSCGGYTLGSSPKMDVDYKRECFSKLYDVDSTDKMLSDLRAVQAAQLQTIKALIDQNYRTIANDPQFTTYINQRISQILKERGL